MKPVTNKNTIMNTAEEIKNIAAHAYFRGAVEQTTGSASEENFNSWYDNQSAQFQPSPVDIEAEEIIADLQGTATALRVNGLKEAAKILDVSIDKLKQYFSREPSAVDTGAEDDLWEEVIELMEAFNDDPCFINPDVITAAKNNYTIARRAGQSKGIKQ